MNNRNCMKLIFNIFSVRFWNGELVEDVFKWLANDFYIAGNAPGGMVEYRRTLVQSLFFKFSLEIQANLYKKGILKVGLMTYIYIIYI